MKTILVISIFLTIVYQGKSDDSSLESVLPHNTDKKIYDWRSKEDKAFYESGICASENRSHVENCKSEKTVVNLHALQRAQCFCDKNCGKYHDCCLNAMPGIGFQTSPWRCRIVREGAELNISIYVMQKCADDWTDSNIRSLCEVEAEEHAKNGKKIDYLQDIPVKSEIRRIFYRNIYCALCNRDNELKQWDSLLYCSGDYDEIPESKFNFSQSFYNYRSQNFKNVLVGGQKRNCRLIINDFKLKNLMEKHEARLCKPVINTCSDKNDEISLMKCNSYTSFVYEKTAVWKVYKNFHCALCNNVNTNTLTCRDPLYPLLKSTSPDFTTGVTLKFLFDFNFEGGNNQIGITSSCKLSDGLMWDPVLKKCDNFTCGALFERIGSKCVPRVTENKIGLNDNCLKRTLSKSDFIIHRNRSIFIKESGKILSPDEYEVNEKDGYDVTSINVCIEEGSYLLRLSRTQYWLSEVTLSLSIICLILHLFVYSSLKELRNCPGKILMSLSICMICGHLSLLIGQYIGDFYWMCYVCGVLTHFGYLSSFLWMNVMAYDIHRTFSMTQSRNSSKKRTFLKYSLYSWITAVFITVFSVGFDNVMHQESEFRPKYGDPICWFNQRKGLLIFFILPIFILLIENVTFFIITAFHIKKISNETKMVKNFSDKIRYLLYIKLTVVFGLTWLLGILAGILRASFLWYPFILLNGLQGVFIFVAFTLKRKIIKMLRIKFKIHSDSYEMGKQGFLKKALYSSMSNLSTLQTTLTIQLPILDENKDILKAVRKINPDSVLEERKF